MSSQARSLIADWRKVLNNYRAASKKIAQAYMDLTESCNDEDKLRVIDIFGNIIFELIISNSKIESYFPAAERDVNTSLIRVDDFLSKVDQKMENVSNLYFNSFFYCCSD